MYYLIRSVYMHKEGVFKKFSLKTLSMAQLTGSIIQSTVCRSVRVEIQYINLSVRM